MSKPIEGDYASIFEKYISLVDESNISQALKNQYQPALNLLNSITEKKSCSAYAPGKWSIKQMLQHMIDAERIFCYRALCISRGEQQNLPGFDENAYASNSNGDSRKWVDLLNEFVCVRVATTTLYSSFNEEMLRSKGLSNGNIITVNSLGFIIAGHVRHHLTILQERYLA